MSDSRLEAGRRPLARPGSRPDCHLPTAWTALVDPLGPLPEYPRPRLQREAWLSLNGPWDFAIRPGDEALPHTFDGVITVPFALESALSGVMRPLLPGQRLWYSRNFEIPLPWAGAQAVALNFGAVDYECEVWLDGVHLGGHRGGYLPFSFIIGNISGKRMLSGLHNLVVAVRDQTDGGVQSRGKQSLKPGGILYSAVSGIWQTVWLEPLFSPGAALGRIEASCDLARGLLSLRVAPLGAPAGPAEPLPEGFRYRVESQEGPALEGNGLIGEDLTLPFEGALPWGPAAPHLYRLSVETEGGDRTNSYFAWRSFGVGNDLAGRRRFLLNGKPLFLHGVLDQGYWPDGLYTAPTDEALAFDIEAARRLGFNMVRKHAKVEPARWYYHAARLGMLVFQDMPSGGRPRNPFVLGAIGLFGPPLDDRKRFARCIGGAVDPRGRQDFLAELSTMVMELRGEAAVASFSPFNEGWGQFSAAEAVTLIRKLDSGRPVDEASGWFDQGGGDFASIHRYSERLPWKARQLRKPGRAWFFSEYGGLTRSVPGHFWPRKKEFGYRRFFDQQGLEDAWQGLLAQELEPKIPQGLAAACYTQLTDVEQETNGLLTYDRSVWKVDEGRAKLAGEALIAAGSEKN
ncbi:MAG: sugar-binding domain-containing protein [Spirochaetota bacterium]